MNNYICTDWTNYLLAKVAISVMNGCIGNNFDARLETRLLCRSVDLVNRLDILRQSKIDWYFMQKC